MNWDNGRNAAEPNIVRSRQIDDYLAPGAPASPYLTSAPPSNYGGASSFDCNVSAAPSILGQSSSYGQFYGTSPTFSSATTSPLVTRDELRYYGSFNTCDGFFPSLGEAAEPPLLDTTRDRIVDPSLPAAGFLNPHVAGSFQTFSNREIIASQILASAGTQFEPFSTDETIAEGDEYDCSTATAPIPIIRTPHQSFPNSYGYYEPSQGTYENRTRAVTIPVPNGRASYNTKASHARWASNAPPVLSTSPLPGRRSRSGTLSRSNSRAEQRRTTASPSPTSAHSLGWVPMQMDSQSGRMSATISSSDTQGRVSKGRKRGLDPKQRSEAALMRIIGSCSNCKKRKEKCDPGTPCRSCLKHYKGDLVNNPCRNHALVNLTETFLSNRHGWHPTDRSLSSCIGTTRFQISTGMAFQIPLHFGFGLPLTLEVHPVLNENGKALEPLVHEHLVYSWPPQSSTPATHIQPVLPAVLSASATDTLSQTLDSHLSHLVRSEFKAFPLYLSPLHILDKVYTFFRSLPASSSSSHLLLQALKLLVLVHVGGDITLPKQSSSTPLTQLVSCTMHAPETARPSPCLIRAQFGAAMPPLATNLMRTVLSDLERLLFTRNETDWPVALATLTVVLMTVESIHYHAAKLPYHERSRPESADGGFDADDGAVNTLLASYKACFSACHTRLHPNWQGDLSAAAGGKTYPADLFVAGVREAVGKERVGAYLAAKAQERFVVDEEDMGFFFDRLVARLLLLEG